MHSYFSIESVFFALFLVEVHIEVEHFVDVDRYPEFFVKGYIR